MIGTNATLEHSPKGVDSELTAETNSTCLTSEKALIMDKKSALKHTIPNLCAAPLRFAVDIPRHRFVKL